MLTLKSLVSLKVQHLKFNPNAVTNASLKGDVIPKILCHSDPVLKLIFYFCGGKIWRRVALPWRAALIAAACGVLCLCAGGLVAAFAPSEIMSPFLVQTFPLEVSIFVIISPLVWLYYVREPYEITALFDGLSQNGVIEQNRGKDGSTIEAFIINHSGTFNKIYWSLISLLITISFLILWTTTAFDPKNPFRFGYPETWWHANPLLFWFWMLLSWIPRYMVGFIMIRRFITSWLIGRFLETFTITPNPFYHDHANGLSPIGKYAFGAMPVLLLAALWQLLVSMYPLFFGQPTQFTYETVIYVVVYLALVFSCLLAPIWKTHKLMCKAKYQALDKTGAEIREIDARGTSGLSRKEIVEDQEAMEALVRKQRLREDEYRTWPFNLASVSKFLAGTLLPLLPTVISLILSLLGMH